MVLINQMDLKFIWFIEVNLFYSSHLFYLNSFFSHLGYIDDVRNTDNAWVEAEIWNFHYGSAMSFPSLRTDVRTSRLRIKKKKIFTSIFLFKGMALWKDVTYNARGFLMQTSILREIARIHDAYFE